MADAHLLPLVCPHCGAAITAPEGDRTVACRYCEHRIAYAAPRPRPNVRMAPRTSKPPVVLAVVLGVLFTVALLVAITLIQRSVSSLHEQVRSPASGAGSGAIAAAPPQPPPAPRVLWDSVGGPPMPATIAGRDAVCGRMRALSDGDQLTFACFAAQTQRKLWETGKLGSYSDAYRGTTFAVVGDRLAYSDIRGHVHVLDVETGTELGAVAVTDRVEAICPSGPHGAFVRVADHRDVAIDLTSASGATSATGAASPKPPAGCGETSAPWDPPRGAPSFPGFAAMTLHVDAAGGLAVVGGHKSPGTELPIAIGFDPKTRTQRWQVAIGASGQAVVRDVGGGMSDALVGGTYVAIYGAGQDGWRIAAWDAKTGAPLWDTPLPGRRTGPTVDGFAAGPNYVYVVESSQLEIVDAKTGAVAGKVGYAL